PLISITEIVALAGEDVSLPCHLKPAVGASSETVVWTKPGLDPNYIHVQKDGRLMCQSQNPSYHYRTRLFKDEHGNIFLKLFAVRISDSGKYFCFLPSIQKKASVQLTVVSNCEKSRLICSHQPIVALAGDDAILPCRLEPAVSASSKTIVWTKPDLIPKYIHVHHEGQIMCPRQNPSYINRTNLFEQELKNGNLSLKLSSVKIQDAGKYFCQLQSMQEEASTQLTVGAVSTPIIQVVLDNSDTVVLQCESEGWYPEPEVFWLDGEGNLLSAGPTETVRGPDDLYTVSSRVTVENRHSNNFTCRVQQKDINQTRDTHIQVTALSELICSRQPIVALAGDDVILPCHLEPAVSAGSETVVWNKPDLDPKYIHFHHDGRLMYQFQNPSYNYRTRLFVDELTKGNVSVKIFSVKISDSGKYFCFLQSLQKEASIQLTVGVVSTLIIHVVSNNSSSVVLQCESAGWYPEPEVFWLDGE
ncbi:butyrophilin-like protein 2, partial [Micropterus dolomieu]|uniref:butyrophilin-like protein 2 n=1 Tax=Micropterus dolomieu TaxID=147949 RepID=UPI001E8DCAED